MAQSDQHRPPVRNSLLRALPPGDLALLWPDLERVDLRSGETLFAAGAPIDAVLFPERGMVSMVAALEDGEQVEVGLAGKEGLVGLPLVLGDDRSLVEARVQLDGAALRIPASAFRAGMERSPMLRGLLTRYALAVLAQVTLAAACNARHAIEHRLARWLLVAHDRAEADEFAMTHEFVSLMLGVRRPGVTIAAGILQKAGLIHYARGRMAITDRPGLEAASCECFRTAQHEFTRLLGPGPSEASAANGG